jgi:hypothetical protein
MVFLSEVDALIDYERAFDVFGTTLPVTVRALT